MEKFELFEDTKFLVIDDQEEILLSLVDKLVELGFDETKITKANNGIDALKKVENSESFEFIITDMVMPEMNGLEFIKSIRKIESYKFTPILVLSSETDFTIIKPAITAGANNYMIKPTTIEVLSQKLVSSIDNANKKLVAL